MCLAQRPNPISENRSHLDDDMNSECEGVTEKLSSHSLSQAKSSCNRPMLNSLEKYITGPR